MELSPSGSPSVHPGFNGSAAAAGDLHPHSGASQSTAPVSTDGHSSPTDQYSGSAADAVTVTVDGSRSRYMALKSLKESKAHTMKLQQLQKSERQHQKDGSRHKRGVRRLSKELYVVVSWYALLQSALFAAVAQTNIFTCADWWGPVCMAGLVTVGTFATALDKLRRMGEEQRKVLQFQARQSAVYDNIEELRLRGSQTKLDSLQPQHEVVPPNIELLCIFSPQGMLVLGFLIGFSALIIISCFSMLCSPPCKCRS